MLFFETPNSIGFSERDIFTIEEDDNKTSITNLNSLLVWFKENPNYWNNDIYLAG